jgi:hypothetical protein
MVARVARLRGEDVLPTVPPAADDAIVAGQA